MKKLLTIIFVLTAFLSRSQGPMVFEDAVEQYKAGNYQQAAERFSQVIREDEFDEKAYLNRGNCWFKLEEYRKAVDDYTSYLKLIPNHDKVFEIIPEASHAFYLRGLANAAIKNHKDAIGDFRRSVETNPPSLPALFALANVKIDTKDYEGAIENLTSYIEYVPTSVEAYSNRGMAKARMGKSLKAIEDFSQAIAIDSANAELYYNRALEKYLLRKDKEALEDFSKAIELRPDDANALYYRGKIYYALNEYENATVDLKKTVELNPNDSKAKDALFSANLTNYLSKNWLYLVFILVFTITAIVLLVGVLKSKNENLVNVDVEEL